MQLFERTSKLQFSTFITAIIIYYLTNCRKIPYIMTK